VKNKEILVKFKIEDKTLKILNYEELKKLNKQGIAIYPEYRLKKKEGNLIIGVNEELGDRLDGWGVYRYYIAILIKDKNSGYLIDTHETLSGWYSPISQKTYSEWLKEIKEVKKI